MTVSLLEILAAARAHAAPLAAESAGYLLLGVADRVVSAPRVTSAELVELSGDGSVRLRAGDRVDASGTADSAERSLRHLLGRVLAVSSSVGPALRRAAERSEDVGLEALVRELETALIPVNRSAARRALARLHRETERARDAGKLEKLLFDLVEPEGANRPAASPAAAVVSAPTPAPAVALPQVAQVRAVAESELRPKAAKPTAPVEDFPVEVVLFSGESAEAPPVAATTASTEEAFTKPEPVVLRARERGHSTPRLGTLLSAQSGEQEWERTDRAPAVQFEVEPELQPETSRLPDVLTAMLELHTGLDADEAPTRLRGVTTSVGQTSPSRELASSASQVVEADDEWLVISSLSGVESDFSVVVPEEQVEPAFHEALTWNPAPVETAALAVVPAVVPVEVVREWAPEAVTPSPTPLPVLILAPVFEPEPSPYVPAVLPVRQSDVSELLQSFHVSGAAEEHELRGALKEMAGLDPTPMPLAYVDEG